MRTTTAFTALALALAGCASGTATPDRAAARDLAVADFADAAATVDRPQRAGDPGARDEATPTDGRDYRTGVGAPDADAPITPAPERRIVVDRVVGQINGQPIYAEAFYRDSERRWREESRKLSPREWTQDLRTYTEQTLYTRLREELLLAEFRSGLSPEQRRGVLAFVENLRKQTVRRAGGSEQEANRRLLEEAGVTLDEDIENQAKREFILQQLRNTIAKRVQVSSRDVELYYRRNLDTFQPAPVAVLRQVAVAKDDEERAAQVDALFASGEVPQSLGTITRVTLDPKGREATKFFAVEALNEPAKRLGVGEHASRIELGDNLWWLRLEDIERREQRSLYDVQLEIEETIRGERLLEEEQRYFERLFERANVSEINGMIAALMDYAVARFYTPGDGG